MSARPEIMTIVTNFRSFPETWTSGTVTGKSVYADSAPAFLKHRQDSGALFVVNGDPRLLFQLNAALLKRGKFSRPRVISVDLVLRSPLGAREWASLPVKRALLSRVNHFIHYFRDLRGMERYFGITPARSSFVPFKVNLVSRHSLQPRPDGEYVLCFGRSMRDYDTFLAAMGQVPYPGAITRPDRNKLAEHHGRFETPLEAIPANVRLLDDDGTERSEVEILSNARLVVLPILRKSIAASGISTCLNAMFLGKCVLGSKGPGMDDVFDREILTFPPEDAGALAAAVRQAWEDDDLRGDTAARGRQYALAVGAEPELYQRIIDRIVEWRSGSGPLEQA